MKKIICLFLIFLSCFCVFGCKNNEIETKLIDVEDIIINKSHAYCNKGEKIVLLAQVYPFNANNQNVLWKSDNQNIAIVNDGIVEGMGEGRTVISAISEDGNFCGTCILFVSNPKLDYEKYPNNLTKSINFYQNINENEENIDKNSENYANLNRNFNYLSEEFESLTQNLNENLNRSREILTQNLNENMFENFENFLQNISGNISGSYKIVAENVDENLSESDDKETPNANFKIEIVSLNFEDNQEFKDKFEDFVQNFFGIEKYFENIENEINIIKNNIFNEISQKISENNAKSVQKIAKNGGVLQEDEKVNENKKYFFEYKFNSNGINDEEDEFTIYKDKNTIIREMKTD